MIFIELGTSEDRIGSLGDNIVTTLQTQNSILESLTSGIGQSIMGVENWMSDSIVYEHLFKGMKEVESNLKEKWDLAENFIAISEDGEVGDDVFFIVREKCRKIANIEGLNESTFLEQIEKRFVKDFDMEIEKYQKIENLKEEQVETIKSDIEIMVKEKINEIATNIFNNNKRDEMLGLCDEWDKEYRQLNYDKLNNISKKLENYFESNVIYKDSELTKRVKKNLYMNDFLQKKLENNSKPTINKFELDLIEKFSNI